MRLFQTLSAITAAFIALPSIAGLPVAAPLVTTSPITTKPAYEFCEYLAQQYGTKTINLGDILPILNGKRDEGEANDLQKRETLSPALPNGRTYTVVPGSRGRRDAASNYYAFGKGGFGPCVVFAYGGAYLNAEIIEGNPTRVITPYSTVGGDFAAATRLCQAVCDNLPRFQAKLSGGSTTCNAIANWIEVDSGDPLNVFGYNLVCDLYPKALTTAQIAPKNPSQYTTGVLANAN